MKCKNCGHDIESHDGVGCIRLPNGDFCTCVEPEASPKEELVSSCCRAKMDRDSHLENGKIVLDNYLCQKCGAICVPYSEPVSPVAEAKIKLSLIGTDCICDGAQRQRKYDEAQANVQLKDILAKSLLDEQDFMIEICKVFPDENGAKLHRLAAAIHKAQADKFKEGK